MLVDVWSNGTGFCGRGLYFNVEIVFSHCVLLLIDMVKYFFLKYKVEGRMRRFGVVLEGNRWTKSRIVLF